MSKALFLVDFYGIALQAEAVAMILGFELKIIKEKFKSRVVMADGLQDNDPPPYLTADYDLLAIGFHAPGVSGPDVEVRQAMAENRIDPLTGFISSRQRRLVDALNAAVNHPAGLVTHHGPENQYPGSEYVDYPILVFDPGEADVLGDGISFIVRQGPVGFRDIHLKLYFWEKSQEGFNLFPNPLSRGSAAN